MLRWMSCHFLGPQGDLNTLIHFPRWGRKEPRCLYELVVWSDKKLLLGMMWSLNLLVACRQSPRRECRGKARRANSSERRFQRVKVCLPCSMIGVLARIGARMSDTGYCRDCKYTMAPLALSLATCCLRLKPLRLITLLLCWTHSPQALTFWRARSPRFRVPRHKPSRARVRCLWRWSRQKLERFIVTAGRIIAYP